MSHDRDKIIKIMNSLEADYQAGKISPEKYRYFHSKYESRLKKMDATNRIRNMQGKKSSYKNNRKPKKYNNRKIEEEKLVQKYIVNPKREPGQENLNKSKSKVSYSLVAVLVLIIAFTAGIGFGVSNLDFEDNPILPSESIVEDTAFSDEPISNLSFSYKENINQDYSVVESSDVNDEQINLPSPGHDDSGNNHPVAPEPNTGTGSEGQIGP